MLFNIELNTYVSSMQITYLMRDFEPFLFPLKITTYLFLVYMFQYIRRSDVTKFPIYDH